jgi:hypothetical protein
MLIGHLALMTSVAFTASVLQTALIEQPAGRFRLGSPAGDPAAAGRHRERGSHPTLERPDRMAGRFRCHRDGRVSLGIPVLTNLRRRSSNPSCAGPVRQVDFRFSRPVISGHARATADNAWSRGSHELTAMTLFVLALAATAATTLVASSVGAGSTSSPLGGGAEVDALSAALAIGRVTPAELKGREVLNDDEVPIGTLRGITPAREGAGALALVALDPRLGLGAGCLAAPLWRMREEAGRRLLLHMAIRDVSAAPREPCRE